MFVFASIANGESHTFLTIFTLSNTQFIIISYLLPFYHYLGLQYFKELKPALEKEDYKNAEKLFEVYVTKYNPNDPNQIDATDYYADFHYYKPMQVMSGTFAERGTSEKQRQLAEQLDKFKKAMFRMENCFKDMKEGGFFSATSKKYTGSEKKKQALQAWKEGKEALSEYIDIFNLGLMREVNPIENPL